MMLLKHFGFYHKTCEKNREKKYDQNYKVYWNLQTVFVTQFSNIIFKNVINILKRFNEMCRTTNQRKFLVL